MRNLAIQVHELFSAKITYLTIYNDSVEEYSDTQPRLAVIPPSARRKVSKIMNFVLNYLPH